MSSRERHRAKGGGEKSEKKEKYKVSGTREGQKPLCESTGRLGSPQKKRGHASPSNSPKEKRVG